MFNQASQYIQSNEQEVDGMYRPDYHLVPPIGWINDPNGFIFYEGHYHLFYQHYPYDSIWGPMHWGHAMSQDLVTWQDLPVALEPIEDYEADGCFSGSAIEKDGKLFLMYTGHYERNGKKRETQCLAYSEDGIHFEKYSGNPVIDESHIAGVADSSDFRDPKVFEREGRYYCVVASKTSDQRGQILLFQSPDLFDWEFVSVLLEGNVQQGIMWECPDLFELDGKDVLIMSPIQIPQVGHQYANLSSTVAFIGQVDWSTGKMAVEDYHEIDGGLDFYAPQTCLDNQGQPVMVAWMQMWERTMPTHELGHGWVGMMTLPRRLSLQDNQLRQEPIAAIQSYLEPVIERQAITLEATGYHLPHGFVEVGKISLDMQLTAADNVEIRLGDEAEYLTIGYDVAKEELSFNREAGGHVILGAEVGTHQERSLSLPLVNGKLGLDIFLDRASIEIFANHQSLTSTFYKKTTARDLSIRSRKQSILTNLVVSQFSRDEVMEERR